MERSMEVENPLQKYVFHEKLGDGPFGDEIFRVRDRLEDNFYLARVLKKEENLIPMLELLRIEIKDLSRVSHENVIKIIEEIDTSEEYTVIMEDCNLGFFSEMVRKKEEDFGFSEKRAKYYTRQLIDGFQALNKEGIVLKNFSFDKIFVHNKVLKIAGLGLENEEELFSEFTSPEVLNGRYTDVTNIWSLGVAFYRLLSGEFPFSGKNKDEFLKSITKPKPLFDDHKNQIDKELEDILKKMLTEDPEKRITWEKLYKDFPIEKISEKKKEKIAKKQEKMIEKNHFIPKKEPKTQDNIAEVRNFANNNTSSYNNNNNQSSFGGLNNQNAFEMPNIGGMNNLNQIFNNNQKNSFEEMKNNNTSFGGQKIGGINNPNQFFMPKIEEEKETQEMMKEKAILRLEKRYIHLKNIIEFYIDVFKEGNIMLGNPYALSFIYFMGIKDVLQIYNNVLNSLNEKRNIFQDPNFDFFQASPNFGTVKEKFEQIQLFSIFFEEVDKIQNFAVDLDDNYLKVSRYLEMGEYVNFVEVYKQIFNEFILGGKFETMSIADEKEKRRRLICSIKMLDCFDYRNAFAFKDVQKEGFDFGGYSRVLENLTTQDLIILFDEKIQNKIA